MNNEDLVKQYLKSGDPKLREQSIIRFLPVVKYVIGRLNLPVRNKTELEDIHSAGIVGLIRALEDFDLSKNTAFKTYATWRVRGHILDYLRKIDFISRGDRTKIRMIEKAISDLSLHYGREPSAFEVANTLGMDLRECHRLLEAAQLSFTISLDQTQQIDGEEVRLSDVIADEKIIGPLTTRLIPAVPSTGMLSTAWVRFRSMRSRSSGSSSWPKSAGVPCSDQWVQVFS